MPKPKLDKAYKAGEAVLFKIQKDSAKAVGQIYANLTDEITQAFMKYGIKVRGTEIDMAGIRKLIGKPLELDKSVIGKIMAKQYPKTVKEFEGLLKQTTNEVVSREGKYAMSKRMTAKQRAEIYKASTLSKLRDGILKDRFSPRLWEFTGNDTVQVRNLMRQALSGEKTPYEVQQSLRNYLRDDIGVGDARFKRVKDLHPGQGIYRSATKNMQRLFDTELREMQFQGKQELWKSNRYITGTDWIMLGDDPCDDCQAMAAGSPYPKDASLEPPHPGCHCIIQPIFKEGFGED